MFSGGGTWSRQPPAFEWGCKEAWESPNTKELELTPVVLIEAGILTEDDKVELLHGRIVAMSPAGSSHASPVNVMTRLVKAPLYAAAGIPEYWIELPEQGAIEVYSRPLKGRYAEMHTYTGGDVVTPGPAPEVLVRVQDVLG